ncbi:hypothetical protein P4N68_02130 [Corynebacterium felinum]|uniref:ABC-2 type transport system permease protein n=1 Tax=Corynebacterium felinum TaxID=131318 RepID=A0ABU2BBH4_9CORY|nr:hypothetical protein [Corynebacterium felinum]MDF5819880.1 hypothetical protein [Corynebacterium felinum]MDR7355977.1 ABC-2 type transport system permease protein [Corynebacterium felinum]WJY95313.1 hypothetical protein CFELI_08540 [Corynebacterium felinum]
MDTNAHNNHSAITPSLFSSTPTPPHGAGGGVAASTSTGATRPKSLTKTLLRLHLVLWRRSLSSNKASLWMNIFILVYSMIGLLSFSALMYFEMTDGRLSALTGAIAAGTLVYLMAAIMIPSGEGQLQPESFAVLPLSEKDIMPSLMIMQFLQTRGFVALICTTVTTVVALLALSQQQLLTPIIVLITIIAMVMSLAVVIVIAETVAIILAQGSVALAKKDKRAYLAAGVMILGWFAYMMLMSQNPVDGALSAYGNFLRWTPIASAGGMVTTAAQGHWGYFLVMFAITALTIACGAYAWVKSTNKRLIAPLGDGGAGTGSKKNTQVEKTPFNTLLLPRLSPSLFNYIYSRALRYHLRDSRLIINIAFAPVMALYFLYMGFIGNSSYPYVGVAVLALVSTMGSTNIFGYDGPANWTHLVAGVPARTLLAGRYLASVTLEFCMFIIYTLIVIALKPTMLTFMVVGLAIGGLMSIIAIAMTLAVRNPFPVAKPGTNPWQDRSGFSAAAFISAFAGFLLVWIPLAPGLALAIFGYINESIPITLAGIALSWAIGAGVLILAIRRNTAYLEQHYVEIFNKVRSYV